MGEFESTSVLLFLPDIWYELSPRANFTTFWKKHSTKKYLYYSVSLYKHSGKLSHPYPELQERFCQCPNSRVADIQWAEICEEALVHCHIHVIKDGRVVPSYDFT